MIYAETNIKKMYIQFNKDLPKNRFFKMFIKQRLLKTFDNCQVFIQTQDNVYPVTDRFGRYIFGNKLRNKVYTSIFLTKKQTIII